MTASEGQRGQAIVIIALMLTVLVGMTAIAIDGSRAYALKRDMQAAVDAAALAASDKLQQSGSYVTAEQAATAIFGKDVRLYGSPSCSAYGTPGASPWTVTCTYADGTTLTQVARALGPQGGQFTISATRSLQLQFARVLTNGALPTLAASAEGGINNLRYTPAVAALGQAGCGGAGGTAISLSNVGSTMSVFGDVVANGTITLTTSSLRVDGDVYARCQSSVSGVTTTCYPSGGTAPCSSPDVAGVTRSGYRLADPGYPAPAVVGGSQPTPGTNVVLAPGAYGSNPNFTTGKCWFLSAGVYEWLGGYTNNADLVSNELKPPDEPVAGNNSVLASPQFWNVDGFDCAGSFIVFTSNDPRNPVRNGQWGVEMTSVRTDTYAGTSYFRESAPSMCHTVNTATRNDIVIQVSNVPGATSYNVYLSQPGNACGGPFGFVGNIPVSGSVTNQLTTPCPIYVGVGCSLGNEQLTIDQTYLGTWAPNLFAAPDTSGAYPPDGETAPSGGSLPNQNPARGAGSFGDRANENACDNTAGAFASCPAAVTPGAVEFYVPAGGCVNANANGDNYLFSGYQYNWVAVYEPPANGCANTFGATINSAFIGLVYGPGASATFPSANVFDGPGTGGVVFGTIVFSGSPPSISYSAAYAPMPPAARLVS
jgi:Flp pilus assembly protein TadG